MRRRSAVARLLLAAVAGCAALSEAREPAGPSQPARSPSAVLVVRVLAETDSRRGARAKAYRIDRKTFAGNDTAAMSKPIRAAKDAAEGRGTGPLRVRIVTDPNVPYEDLRPILEAAAACGVLDFSLSFAPATPPGPAAKEPEAVEFTLPVHEIEVIVGRSGRGKARYDLRQGFVATSERGLTACLEAMGKRLAGPWALRLTAERGAPSRFLAGAMAAGRKAGCVRVKFGPPGARTARAYGERRSVLRRYPKREDGTRQGEPDKTVPSSAPSPDGAKGVPRSRFFGTGGNAYHIVYVVDRSESMAPTFDEVRIELLKSISRLKPVQDFDVILFANNKVIEGPRQRLVPADITNKLAATRFLKKVTVSGQTEALPALKRAFTVLEHADGRRAGTLIYLLSDGDFAGVTGGSTYKTPAGKVLHGNEAVLQWLRDNNKDKKIRINTVLYFNKSASAKKVMAAIARENGGRYTHIAEDD